IYSMVGEDEFHDDNPPPPPPPPVTPTQQTPHTLSTIKLPILKKGEYDIWAMKMKHYLGHTDYPIWEVIQKGNGPVQVSTDTNGQIRVLPPKTAEEILARERERKARTTLLMSIPEYHLAKFHKMTDAKEMWEAIKSRFGGNDESKKMQKYILKQQFESFSVSNSEGLHKGYDRFLSFLPGPKYLDHEVPRPGVDSSQSKGNQDIRRRDAANTGYKAKDNGRRPGKQEEPKALAQTLRLFSHLNVQEITMAPKYDFGIDVSQFNYFDDEYVVQPSKEQEKLSFAFVNTVKHVKTLRETIKEQNTCNQIPKVDKRDWNGLMSKKLGLGYGFTRKACFVCGSFGHLIRDCDFHEKRMAKQVELNKKKSKDTGQGGNRPVWNNVQRLNHQNKFVPIAVLIRNGRFPVNTTRHNFNSQAVSTSAARKANADDPQKTLKGKGIIDSGCSRHMTRNKAYLVEYQEFQGGSVVFGGSKGHVTPLFPNMLAQAVVDEGEGSEQPTEPQPTPSPVKYHGMDYMETEEVVNEGKQSNEAEELNLDVDTEVIAEDKGSGEKGGTARPEVDTARPDVDAARQEVSAVEPRTPPTTTSIFDDEDITHGLTLINAENKRKPRKKEWHEEPVRVKRKINGIDQSIDVEHCCSPSPTRRKRRSTQLKKNSNVLAENNTLPKKKFRAAQRAAEIRSRPPTKSQLRNLMMTYLNK
ncbi:ribonuclease H-like domain-containing protein, partial [Tanacetum coccineum]